MKFGDICIGYTGEEVIASVLDNDIAALSDILKDFSLVGDYQPRPLSADSRSASATLLNYASVFAGRSKLTQETALLLINNLSMDVNVFCFIDMLLYFIHDDARDKKEHVRNEIFDILKKNEPNPSFAGYIERMNENEFIAFCEQIISEKYEILNVSFTTPIIRFVYTHQMMPLTLLFAYMASTLRLPTLNIGVIDVTDMIGQVIDGIFGEPEGDKPT